MHFYGPPNSTKSSTGKVVLAVDGHETDDDYIISMSQVDTLARLGDTISKTTFPILSDEMELIDNRTGKENTTLTSAIKSAIDKPIARKVLSQSREKEKIPALSALIMTSNQPPPFQNAALMKRLAIRHHSIHETHLKGRKDAQKFDNEIVPNLHKLHVIGRLRNRIIADNEAIILDKKLTSFQKARLILEATYKTDNNRQIPQWFDKELKQVFLEESLSDAKDAVIVAFETMIINKMKNLKGSLAFDTYKNAYDRLGFLVDNKLLPFCKEMRSPSDHKATGNYGFYSGVIRELQAEGVTTEQLPNLSTFASLF